MRVRLGLAAWSNRHFDHALYPLGTLHAEWLPRYATLFDCAEADILHHQAAEEGTLHDWVERTPEGFLFLPKLHKDATHGGVQVRGAGRLGRQYSWLRPQLPADPAVGAAQAEDDASRTGSFLASLEPLRAGGRLGPILVQFSPNTDRVTGWDRLLSILGSAPPGTFAVEVREKSWFVPAFENLLEDFEAPLVWSTVPSAFAPPWRTSDYGYIRFTGKHQKRRGRHVTVAQRQKDVDEVARRLKQATWDTCYAIVTNGFEGNAVDSMPNVARAFGVEAVHKRLAARPPGQVLFPDPPGHVRPSSARQWPSSGSTGPRGTASERSAGKGSERRRAKAPERSTGKAS